MRSAAISRACRLPTSASTTSLAPCSMRRRSSRRRASRPRPIAGRTCRARGCSTWSPTSRPGSCALKFLFAPVIGRSAW